MKKINKKALEKSFWSSLSRVIGIGLSAAAGSMLNHVLGNGLQAWGLAVMMAIVSFLLMLFAEYEREK